MDLPEPLANLRRALMRRSGGDRLMADVLARLKDPQRPPSVTTALTLKVAPVADTTRYDRLRTSAPAITQMNEERGHAN